MDDRPEGPAYTAFLPRNRSQMERRGWDSLDVLLVTGDGYVDHPSMGVPVIGRVLEAQGLRVGILDVPELEEEDGGDPWHRLPAPRLFVGISAGAIDSMLCNQTAAKRPRRTDAYRPGGRSGRPNRASISYTAAARHHFPGVPVVLGGIEASSRRLAHHDYWQEAMRRSILVDAKADLLVWGMGERQVLEIARRRAAGESLAGLAGTCEVVREDALPPAAREVPGFEELRESPDLLTELFGAVRDENRPAGAILAQRHGDRYVLQHPPLPPGSAEELDSYHELPFQRASHPDHEAAGGIPALETVRWSIATHRGCMADCSFCSISFHQGRSIQSRTEGSIRAEAERLLADPEARGTISDVGGPTANMYGLRCARLDAGDACLDRECLTPDVCPALRIDKTTERYRELLASLRELDGAELVRVSSGIRHDLLMGKKGNLLPLHHDLLRHHVGGQLKLAPEHASPTVLRAMNKTGFDVYERYERAFKADCKELGRDQHLVNYFVAGHPGTTLEDAVLLFEKLLARNHSPEQVQEFIPLPMTRACVQYVTGRDPLSGEALHVPRGARERRVQKALMRWKASESRSMVEEALRECGREDLLPRFRSLTKAGKAGKASGARRGGRVPPELDTCG